MSSHLRDTQFLSSAEDFISGTYIYDTLGKAIVDGHELRTFFSDTSKAFDKVLIDGMLTN